MFLRRLSCVTIGMPLLMAALVASFAAGADKPAKKDASNIRGRWDSRRAWIARRLSLLV